MSILGTIANAFKSGAKELSKEYGKDKKFLEAVCASCALVAYADGTLEENEKKTAIAVLTGHVQLSSLYQRVDIENALNSALSQAQTSSGKLTLARELDAVVTLPNGPKMAEDVFMVAVDVSSANSRGKPGEQEQDVLNRIAKRLHVDPASLEL